MTYDFFFVNSFKKFWFGVIFNIIVELLRYFFSGNFIKNRSQQMRLQIDSFPSNLFIYKKYTCFGFNGIFIGKFEEKMNNLSV